MGLASAARDYPLEHVGVGIRFNPYGDPTTLCEKPAKIGARIVHHGRYVVSQLAEVAVPRVLFAAILRRVDQLRPRSPPLPA